MERLVTASAQLRDVITQVSQDVMMRDSADFLAMAPVFISSMNSLLLVDQCYKVIFLRKLSSTTLILYQINMYWQLKKQGVEYIHAAKDSINSKLPQAAYQSALTRITSHLHRFITALSVKNDTIQAAVKSGRLFDFGQDRMRGRDTLQQALVSSVKRMTSLLGERFLLFQREWDTQTEEEKAQMTQILIQNLHWHMSNHLAAQQNIFSK